MQEALHDRLIKRIVAKYPVSYEKLETLATTNGYTLLEFITAMEVVHKDKRVVQATKGDTIEYRPFMAKPEPEIASHVAWCKNNYPSMDETNNGQHEAFTDMDFSFLFLTPEELDKWKAEQKGMAYVRKKRYQHGK